MSPERDLQDALALIIACTRRAHHDRPKDIVAIAESITYAKESMGSLGDVARAVGVSEQQLRDFLAVMRLDDQVKERVRTRVIDSVDVVKNLAKLPADKQKMLAEGLKRGQVNSADVRVITSFALQFPQKKIETIISEYARSKDTRVYVIRFKVPEGLTRDALNDGFAGILGRDGIHDLYVTGQVAGLELTEAGYRRLREQVRQSGSTLRGFVRSAVQVLAERK